MNPVDTNNLSVLFKEGLNKQYSIANNGVSFAIDYDKTTLKIYFQWSKEISDWIYNFDFPAQSYRDTPKKWYIHRGFKKAWKSIEDDIKFALTSELITEVQIVGYSHGAALAMLCHEFCKFHRPELKITGYGFGCPRVLWGLYGKDILSRWDGFYNIRNYDDIVTHLPPQILGYKHVGEVVDLTPKGKYNKRGQALYNRYVLPHTEAEIIRGLEAYKVGNT